ncbi:YgeY family selenium metabolism-linked hydrolase [Entomomonas moraniae]|uniref:YgeY family selenium metabolism-linked hydrolase n=1 Tax=Entomomonas moraniae TaxID=2213226 RepID=A0A3Q9JL36_9GAMM|nr:YgeY family selenium metabolism-linked hydrolase [Entomomonas moraniae]AZS52158.1 YgeY family selenium metabolism-linked hydrolase [Entomomonas moraniae]
MALTKPQQEQVIALCQTLIQAQSYSGEESLAAKAFTQFMHAHNFDEIVVDSYGSVLGCIKGNYPGPTVLLDGHIDTVPVDSSKWTHAPFGAERVDGKIYGRGSSDMKGAVAAMACAAAFFADASNRQFAGKLYVSGVVHEECFEGIAARAISKAIKPDLVVIGEASELNLKIGQRGRAEVIVETFGVPAHSANPHKGVNAVHLMCELIRALDDIAPPKDDVLGEGVSVLTDIISTPYPGASVVPSHCRATYDRRLLVGETPESVLKPYQEAIAMLEKKHPQFKAAVSYAQGAERCYTGAEIAADRFFPGWCAKEDEPFVQKALSAIRQEGIDATLAYYPFCTNGSHYAGEAHINTIGFGPSLETLAHVIDEYIEEVQLIKATEGYIGICKAFLSN